ncbi:MAG TPA: efflux RND transporter periplasmic adaptor subunit [Phycisphaerae bacterium]|nr:efflux RND transporter periplasmic adaptor subunit [Phycisphaerae bacterium]HPS53340.1 efflux RND transporter periplasmic adaptor subunit [Phycisphaerae bacterium]
MKFGHKKSGWVWAKALPIIFAVAVVVLVIKFYPNSKNEQAVLESPPVTVEVMTINPDSSVRDVITLPGHVEPNKVVDVAAEVAGRVDAHAGKADRLGKGMEITRGPASAGVVNEGDYVKQGQPIVYINTDILLAQCEKTLAEYEFQQQEFKRVSELYGKDVATRTELETTKMNRDMAKAAYDLCRANLERTVVVAPITGRVNSLPVEAGEYVQPGNLVAEFVDMDTAKIVVEVPERDISYMKLGQKQNITVGTFSPTTLQGKISYISDLADEKTHTTRVEIVVDNKNRALRSGQFVKVELLRRELESPIMAPLGVIIPMEQGHAVYVVENDTAQRRDVELDYSLLRGQFIRISKGLKKGDRLIVAGQRLVGPGQKVRIRSTGMDTLLKADQE